MAKKIFSIFLRISISIVLLIFLFRQVDKDALIGVIRGADKYMLFEAFCVFFLSYLLCILRWEMLLKALKIHLPFKRVVISYAGGIFFSLFLPSTIGGDLMRSVDLAAHTKKPTQVVATVLLDRLSGYVGLVILAISALLFGGKLVRDKSVLLSVLIISGLLIGILLVIFNRPLYNLINRFLHSPNSGKFRFIIKSLHDELHYFRSHKDVIIDNLIISIFIQAIVPITFFMISRALGMNLNIIYFFIFLPLITAITLLPISLGGLGLRDATTIFFFAKVGLGKDLAFAMSLLNFSFILVYGVIGGLIYVFTIHHRRLQHHQTPVS